MPALRYLALKQLSDYDAHTPGRIFEGPCPIQSQTEAYELQIEVARLRIERGELIAGYKIGCVSEIVRKQLGIDRALFGHVWDSELHESGVALDPNTYANLAIEGEFAVRLAADIPDRQWLEAHKLEVLATMFPVIELHNYIFRSSNSALELIANNGIHAGAVLPSKYCSRTDPDLLLSETISVYKNGEKLGETEAGSVPGGAFTNLCRLTEHLSLYGIQLRRGQIILTGTPLPLYSVQAGDRIEVRTLSFEAVKATVLSE